MAEEERKEASNGKKILGLPGEGRRKLCGKGDTRECEESPQVLEGSSPH